MKTRAVTSRVVTVRLWGVRGHVTRLQCVLSQEGGAGPRHRVRQKHNRETELIAFVTALAIAFTLDNTWVQGVAELVPKPRRQAAGEGASTRANWGALRCITVRTVCAVAQTWGAPRRCSAALGRKIKTDLTLTPQGCRYLSSERCVRARFYFFGPRTQLTGPVI